MDGQLTDKHWSRPKALGLSRDISSLSLPRDEAVQLCQLLADNSREGLVFMDQAGQLVLCNAAAATLFGGSDKLIGRCVDELMHPVGPDGKASITGAALYARLRNNETCSVKLRVDSSQQYLIHMRKLSNKHLAAVAWLRKSPRQLMDAEGQDGLTGLAGRQAFESCLNYSVERVCQGGHHGLLYIDIYQFKVINQACGNEAGDELLRQFAGLLKKCMRPKDQLARLGSDEFGVLLEDTSISGAQQMASRILQAVSNYSFRWAGQEFNVGISVGAVAISDNGQSANQLLAAANAACNAAKESGRNRIKVHTSNADEANRQRKLQWVARIQKAIAEDRFVLFQQRVAPSSDLNQGHHCEVLLRMRSEQGDLVLPNEFIPAAEQYGMMEELDRLVLMKLLQHMQQQQGEQIYAVNISGVSLGDSKFCHYACNKLDETGVDPRRLHFEITETAAIANQASAIEFIQVLSERGCKFYLDDFGRGQSSLAYLRELPVHYLKIDGYFVRNMLDEPKDFAMVSTINHLAHVMGLETVAEFVESEELLQALQSLGVDYVQGYLIGQPVAL